MMGKRTVERHLTDQPVTGSSSDPIFQPNALHLITPTPGSSRCPVAARGAGAEPQCGRSPEEEGTETSCAVSCCLSYYPLQLGAQGTSQNSRARVCLKCPTLLKVNGAGTGPTAYPISSISVVLVTAFTPLPIGGAVHRFHPTLGCRRSQPFTRMGRASA